MHLIRCCIRVNVHPSNSRFIKRILNFEKCNVKTAPCAFYLRRSRGFRLRVIANLWLRNFQKTAPKLSRDCGHDRVKILEKLVWRSIDRFLMSVRNSSWRWRSRSFRFYGLCYLFLFYGPTGHRWVYVNDSISCVMVWCRTKSFFWWTVWVSDVFREGDSWVLLNDVIVRITVLMKFIYSIHYSYYNWFNKDKHWSMIHKKKKTLKESHDLWLLSIKCFQVNCIR